MKIYMEPVQRFFFIIFLWTIALDLNAQATLQGTVSFLNSGSRPAVGVDISAFGASTVPTTESGMFVLKFPNKKPGDKVKIIVGSKDRDGTNLELVNDKVIAQVRIPSNPEDDIVEIIVCKIGQRNDAALRYNGIIVKTINEQTDKRLHEIDKKLESAKIDAETIVSLQNEKEKLAAERDSALAKAEEQALFIASINLDKASKLVREAVIKVDSLRDIPGAIEVLNNEMLYQAYLAASEKKKNAEAEIEQVLDGFRLKIKLLTPFYRYDEISECYEKIIDIFEKNEGDGEKLISILIEAGSFFNYIGKYQIDLELTLKALAIRERIQPENLMDLSHLYHNVAVAYGNVGDNKNQLKYIQKSITIRENISPKNDILISNSYSVLASYYGAVGDYRKQLEYNLKTLDIREINLPSNHIDLAEINNNIAFTYNKLGDYQRSLDFFLKALIIFEKNHPFEHPNLSSAFNNIAVTYGDLGDYKNLMMFSHKALIIQEKVLPPNHPDLAITYNNIAWANNILGNHEDALEFFLKSFNIIKLSSSEADIAGSYNNLAVTYSNLHNNEKALEYSLLALKIKEKILPPEHLEIARSYANTGSIYRELGENVIAIDYIQKAIQIGEASNPKHPSLNRFYANLGITYTKTRQFSEAKSALEKSERLKQEERVYRGWVMYYTLQKKKKEAIGSLKKAVSLGFKDLKWLETEPDLKNIRKEKGYKDIIKQLQKP